MSESIKINFAEPVGLFPLPQCVLLPSASIPLHIFEPRYKKMVSDALDGPGLIAMATFQGSSWKKQYEGTPPVRPVVCLGYIGRHDRMYDGRYNIVLQGVCRAIIAEETASEPYRKAMLVPMENQIDDEGMLASSRAALMQLLRDPAVSSLANIGKIGQWINESIPTPAAYDVIGHLLAEGNLDRYDLLSEPDFFARASQVESVLMGIRRSIRIADKFKPADLTDGMHMN